MVIKCADCQYSQLCRLDRVKKMHGHQCWIDEIVERGKYQAKKVFSVCFETEKCTGIELPELIDGIVNNAVYILSDFIQSQQYWRDLSQTEKRDCIREHLDLHISERIKYDSDFTPPSDKDINNYVKVLLEIIDCVCDSHRDGDMVTCLRCGELIPNNSKHNRKHCDWCKGYDLKRKQWKICPDCGEGFIAETPNNRQFRCEECQAKANKAATKLRVQRYRERKKCNDINLKD